MIERAKEPKRMQVREKQVEAISWEKQEIKNTKTENNEKLPT